MTTVQSFRSTYDCARFLLDGHRRAQELLDALAEQATDGHRLAYLSGYLSADDADRTGLATLGDVVAALTTVGGSLYGDWEQLARIDVTANRTGIDVVEYLCDQHALTCDCPNH